MIEKDINPLTNQGYSEEYFTIKEKIDNLPASNKDIKKELFELIDDNDIIVIKGETGSGKSTAVPQYLLKEYLLNKQSKDETRGIVVTQPRTLNAKNIASFVAKVVDVELGQEVGYKFRNDNKTSKSTILSYVTDGTFLQEVYGDKGDFNYDIVMIDEVHERSVNVDIILMLIKKYLEKSERKTKFVIMSATLEFEPFEEYYSKTKIGYIEIPGRTFPVKSIYLKKSIYGEDGLESDEDYYFKLLDILEEILSDTDKGDILIFVESIKAIQDYCREFDELFEDFDVACFGLYRGVTEEQQVLATDKDAFRKLPSKPKRKIVISTDIAESGVTVEGILFVIETGLRYSTYFKNRINYLRKEFVTKDSSEQRKGRAGRVAPGTCYHLYTKDEFEHFKNHKPAEIVTTNIDSTILNLLGNEIIKNITDLREFFESLMDKPKDEQINESLEYLSQLNLIQDYCGVLSRKSKAGEDCLTTVGECSVKLPTEPAISKVALVAYNYGVLYDVLKIIAMLNIEDNLDKWFMRPPPNDKEKTRLFNDKIKKYQNGQSDLIAMLKLYDDINKTYDFRKRREWAKKNFINPSIVGNINREYKRVKDAVNKIGYSCRINNILPRSKNNNDNIINSFIHGFYNQLAIRKGPNKYAVVDTLSISNGKLKKRKSIEIKPLHRNFVSKTSKYILYISHNNILGNDNLTGIINVRDVNALNKLLPKLNLK